MNEKWQRTMDAFDEYERRFATARAEKKPYAPWKAADREKILEEVKSMLGYREELVPNVGDFEEVWRTSYDGYDAIRYRYETWKDFYGASTLYMPKTEKKSTSFFIFSG